jgi:hypothetical protein
MDIRSAELQSLRREQTRLRTRFAIVLVGTICLFALFLSWLAQDNPIAPLVMAKVSMIGIGAVYAIGLITAALYTRWIRTRRQPNQSAEGDVDRETPV